LEKKSVDNILDIITYTFVKGNIKNYEKYFQSNEYDEIKGYRKINQIIILLKYISFSDYISNNNNNNFINKKLKNRLENLYKDLKIGNKVSFDFTEKSFLRKTKTQKLNGTISSIEKHNKSGKLFYKIIGPNQKIYKIEEREIEIKEIDLSSVVNSFSKDSDDFNIFLPIMMGYLGIVELLIEKYNKNINAKNEDNKTALMLAARYGHLDIVKLLVKKGAKIGQEDKTIIFKDIDEQLLEIEERKNYLEENKNPNNNTKNKIKKYNNNYKNYTDIKSYLNTIPVKGGSKNINFKNYTIVELKSICRENKLKNYSNLNKDNLIKLLKKR
jgi:ankyrin repeat protein